MDFAKLKIAVMQHRGDPRQLGNTLREFIQWRRKMKLPPHKSRTFNLIYDDPETSAPDDFRFDLCAEIPAHSSQSDWGIPIRTIPAGRCAVIRHIGSDDHVIGIVDYLYREWLDQNEHELGDLPLFYERISFFPEVSEHEMITGIYLPLRQ